MFVQKFGDPHRIADVAFHSKRKSFQSLNQQKRVGGRNARSRIAQSFRPQLHQKAVMAKRIEEPQAVIRGRWIGDGREPGKIEFPRIDNRPADTRTMPAQKFRGGVSHDRRTPVDRTTQIRRGKRIVDDQRNMFAVRQSRQGFKIQHRSAGIANRFSIKAAGLGCNRFFPCL